MAKTIQEINQKIKKGQAVVVTAEEIIDIVDEQGVSKAAKQVDVVTTGTFGPMCSSGAYFNIGHSKPKIKLGGGRAYLNGVPVYTGLAAVDFFLGATALPEDDPANRIYPGEFKYGGGHLIQEIVAGRDVRLIAHTPGTDCYPQKDLDTWLNIRDLNEAVLFNPRNCYQNYNVAVNLSDKIIYTYMGELKPNLGNANYSSAGQLSPLMNDPLYKTIGIGTRIFLGGGSGYITWHGTQHNPAVKRTEEGVPRVPAGTLAVIGNLKKMSPEWLRGTSMRGYGATLTLGIGVPIPMLNEEICRYTAVKDEQIYTQVVDYSHDYPAGISRSLAEVTYKELRQGKIKLKGKNVPTGGLSSYRKARQIAGSLKEQIIRKEFCLTQPVARLPQPDSGYQQHGLQEREVN